MNLRDVFFVGVIISSAFANVASAQESSGSAEGYSGEAVSTSIKVPPKTFEYFHDLGRYTLDGKAKTGRMTIAERIGEDWIVSTETLEYLGRERIPDYDEEGFHYKVVSDPTREYLFVFNKAVEQSTECKPAQYRIWTKVGSEPKWRKWRQASGVSY